MKKTLAIIMAAAMILVSGIQVRAEAATKTVGALIYNEPGYEVTVTKMYDTAFEMLSIVNAERAKAGLGPLTMDPELMESAMLRATEITLLFSHTRPDGSRGLSASERIYGENVAYGYETAAIVMNGWMNSPAHSANILKPEYKIIGIGVVTYNGIHYWAQSFGYDSPIGIAQQKPNTTEKVIIRSNPLVLQSNGVDTSKYVYRQRSIDDQGVQYPAGTMHRLYNPGTREHFFTSNIVERNNVFAMGWQYEGIAWQAPTISSTPVYRLRNNVTGDHHYTAIKHEKDVLDAMPTWTYEGIGWYSDDNQGVPLYRLSNPNLTVGAHHYTKSTAERDLLMANGWNYEGIGWYGIKE